MGAIAATVVGLLGTGGVLLFVVLLLRPYALGFSVKAGATYRALWDQGILEQPMVDLALAEAFEERRNQNAQVVARLTLFLALALASLMLGGRRPRGRRGAKLIAMSAPPPKAPAKPANVPVPNSVPKLPQTIFNLEKRGGSGSSGIRRAAGRPRPGRG